jgi:2-oxoglutarate dehydrogenase E2 component (dihydrolipoamide succinyltransferase)
MSITVTMPQMGESVVEGTLEKWVVREGDHVEKDQTLCEMTTDKVDAEIPSPGSGVIARILVPEGTTVDVGAELVVIDTDAAGSDSAPAPRPAAAAVPAAPAEATSAEGGPRSSPLARRIAEDEGLSLDQLKGTGAGGRITKADVVGQLERSDAPRAAPPETSASAAPGTLGELLGRMRVPKYTPSSEDTVVPFSTIRKRIAEHMIVSKIVSPHVGTVAEVDLHTLVAQRESVKAAFKKAHGFNLTYLPFVVQSVVRALKQVPRMNSTVVDQNIIERSGIHIGVAVETEKGLVVPVIRDADHLSLTGLAEAIEKLAGKARDRKLVADDLHGGTFTISNPGRQGNLYGFAVINQPQVGILRMGEVKKRPVVIDSNGDDTIAIHPMMYLSLSYDHRIIDGVTGNGFLYRVARNLESGGFEV